ncbi:MAG: hypothetical protein ACLVAI_01320, partial [Anaerovoracaceae bacterium]
RLWWQMHCICRHFSFAREFSAVVSARFEGSLSQGLDLRNFLILYFLLPVWLISVFYIMI